MRTAPNIVVFRALIKALHSAVTRFTPRRPREWAHHLENPGHKISTWVLPQVLPLNTVGTLAPVCTWHSYTYELALSSLEPNVSLLTVVSRARTRAARAAAVPLTQSHCTVRMLSIVRRAHSSLRGHVVRYAKNARLDSAPFFSHGQSAQPGCRGGGPSRGAATIPMHHTRLVREPPHSLHAINGRRRLHASTPSAPGQRGWVGSPGHGSPTHAAASSSSS